MRGMNINGCHPRLGQVTTVGSSSQQHDCCDNKVCACVCERPRENGLVLLYILKCHSVHSPGNPSGGTVILYVYGSLSPVGHKSRLSSRRCSRAMYSYPSVKRSPIMASGLVANRSPDPTMITVALAFCSARDEKIPTRKKRSILCFVLVCFVLVCFVCLYSVPTLSFLLTMRSTQ